MVATAARRRGLRCLGLAWLLRALLQCQAASALYVQVYAHEEECFFEQGMVGAIMVLSFQVRRGGGLDIDVAVTGPDHDLLLQLDRQTCGRYAFHAHLPGPYKFCFSNRVSTLSPKIVMFTVHPNWGPAPAKAQDEEDWTQGLEEVIMELAEALLAIKREQEHMELQDRIHRDVSENTNLKVITWAFFEASILLTMSLGQLYYLRNCFQVHRPLTQADLL
ncbi:transmembrane emp24 domain-containing protein 2-like [Macrotis lagotis]|uniref:transmembrane emp24 domain-containing protein 2-like n=1 Tax=Macrotis lagotis TaxID=92651 RepID=UPI003D68FC62